MIGIAQSSPRRRSLTRLVGSHEAAQGFGIDAAIAMRDRLEGDVIDARLPGRRPVRQARQLAAVAFGQMPLGGADLLFDQVEIVEQPLAGRRDPALLAGHGSQQLADADQLAFVRGQTPEQAVPFVTGSQPVRRRQRLAVLRHLIGTVQFGTQRCVLAGQRPCPSVAAQAQFQLTKISGELRAGIQTGWPFRKSKNLRMHQAS